LKALRTSKEAQGRKNSTPDPPETNQPKSAGCKCHSRFLLFQNTARAGLSAVGTAPGSTLPTGDPPIGNVPVGVRLVVGPVSASVAMSYSDTKSTRRVPNFRTHNNPSWRRFISMSSQEKTSYTVALPTVLCLMIRTLNSMGKPLVRPVRLEEV
jgi:hypothetical protein